MTAGVRISELPAASAANDSDQFEVNQAGTTRRVTLAQIADAVEVVPVIPGVGSVHYATDYGVVADGVTDNAVTLQAAVNSFPNNKGRLILPPGIIRTSAQIELPCVTYDGAVLIEGAGKSATTVRAMAGSWAGKAVFYRHNTVIVIGGGLLHLTVDAAQIADYGVWFRTGKQTVMESLTVISSRVTDGLFGDVAVERCYESKFVDCSFYSGSSGDPALRPDYNLRLVGYASDTEIIRTSCSNAKLANIKIESAGVTLIGCHPFGGNAAREADYCFDVGQTTILIGCYADGFTTAGIRLGGNSSSVIGCRFFWPSTTTGDAVRLAAGRSNISIVGSTYYTMPATALEVMYEGGVPVNSYIQAGLIKTDGSRMFIGYPNSLGALNNGRLQIAGTDFNGSVSGLGRWSADVSGPFVSLHKSRATAIGDHAIVAVSDQLGIVDFAGDDGAVSRSAARIQARVDGTPAAGDMPGRLEFLTVAPGGVTLAVNLTVGSRGNVVVGPAAIAANATDGFLYIPSCPGPPTGVPRSFTGRVPLVIDSTSNKLWFYSAGAWRDAGP